mgnify:CR=1 FL=1
MDLSKIKLEEEINLNKLIINLENLSNIKEYDKIYIENEIVIIDEPYFFQSVIRTYNRHSRQNAIDEINKIISSVFEYLDYLNSEDNIFKEKNIYINNKLNQHLIKTIPGLQNLKITYFSDLITTKQIDLIIIKIQNRIDKIIKLLK